MLPINAGNWCWTASGGTFLFAMETAVGIFCPGFRLPIKKNDAEELKEGTIGCC